MSYDEGVSASLWMMAADIFMDDLWKMPVFLGKNFDPGDLVLLKSISDPEDFWKSKIVRKNR